MRLWAIVVELTSLAKETPIKRDDIVTIDRLQSVAFEIGQIGAQFQTRFRRDRAKGNDIENHLLKVSHAIGSGVVAPL